MYHQSLHQQINRDIAPLGFDIAGKDNAFYARLIANSAAIQALYLELYGNHPSGRKCFDRLISLISRAYQQRPAALRRRDERKLREDHWYCSQELAGMSLYVDRFAGSLPDMSSHLDYLQELGINLLHLMPIFESPPDASDGGYAVSDFRKVDPRFGTLEDLKRLQKDMMGRGMYLMLDIVLNHTSERHEWAQQAQAGDPFYRDFFYTFPDRTLPDLYEQTMPEIFPESAPGSFTWNDAMQRWVMTVFHDYQWDLNYTNPEVLLAMLDNVLFYANLGVDVLRIDAPAFIWKQPGTTCQNLPQAHTILRLIRQCVDVAAPGMALLGEAIVAPAEIMQYFGTGLYSGRECQFAYNATQMALQWDMLATGDTRVMLAAQHLLLQKPVGASWITYTRCHDDIGLGYDDYMIVQAGFDPWEHRRFLKDYYSGQYDGSPARGALFGVNPKTQDARISGTLASLCGLEAALGAMDEAAVDIAIRRILLMQAHSMFIGGLPMLFYGDELGYLNDYAYLNDTAKSYDNRWMHRPVMDWQRNDRRRQAGTVEQRIFDGTKRLIALRKSLPAVADTGNLVWMTPHNIHVAGFVRHGKGGPLACVFNFHDRDAWLTWYAFREKGLETPQWEDLWSGERFTAGADDEYLVVPAYAFMILRAVA